jgi:hypothetical protein
MPRIWNVKINGAGFFSTILADGRPFSFNLAYHLAIPILILILAQRDDLAIGSPSEGWRTKPEIAAAVEALTNYGLYPSAESLGDYFSDIRQEMLAKLNRIAPGAELPILFETRNGFGARIPADVQINLIGRVPGA